jgi:hypothetical protein
MLQLCAQHDQQTWTAEIDNANRGLGVRIDHQIIQSQSLIWAKDTPTVRILRSEKILSTTLLDNCSQGRRCTSMCKLGRRKVLAMGIVSRRTPETWQSGRFPPLCKPRNSLNQARKANRHLESGRCNRKYDCADRIRAP